jgi:hypothetical protein
MNPLNQADLLVFREQGYLKIENALPPALLLQLQALFHHQMFETPPSKDLVFNEKNGRQYVCNIENLCNKGDLSCLALLGHPLVVSIATTLCGPDFFPVQDFAVIKMLGDDTPVLWHQDMLNRRSAPSFTMGIYLDEAAPNDGALRVVPGSHLANKNICALQQEPFVDVPMQAGGILVHDMMLAHSSPPLTKNQLRRVIYFEFLSAELVRQETLYDEALIERRQLLQAAACAFYAQQHPAQAAAPYMHSDRFAHVRTAYALEQVYREPVRAHPSAYCFEHH